MKRHIPGSLLLNFELLFKIAGEKEITYLEAFTLGRHDYTASKPFIFQNKKSKPIDIKQLRERIKENFEEIPVVTGASHTESLMESKDFMTNIKTPKKPEFS